MITDGLVSFCLPASWAASCAFCDAVRVSAIVRIDTNGTLDATIDLEAVRSMMDDGDGALKSNGWDEVVGSLPNKTMNKYIWFRDSGHAIIESVIMTE